MNSVSDALKATFTNRFQCEHSPIP